MRSLRSFHLLLVLALGLLVLSALRQVTDQTPSAPLESRAPAAADTTALAAPPVRR